MEIYCQVYTREEFKKFAFDFAPKTVIDLATDQNWMLDLLPKGDNEKPTRIKVPAADCWSETGACFLTTGGTGASVEDPLQIRYSVVVTEETYDEPEAPLLRFKVVFLSDEGILQEVTMMTADKGEHDAILELLQAKKEAALGNSHFCGEGEVEWKRIL